MESWEDRSGRQAKSLGLRPLLEVEDPEPGGPRTATRAIHRVNTPRGVRTNQGSSTGGEDLAVERASKKSWSLLFRWALARRVKKMKHPRPFWNFRAEEDGGWWCFVAIGKGAELVPIGRGRGPTKGQALESALRGSTHPLASRLLEG